MNNKLATVSDMTEKEFGVAFIGLSMQLRNGDADVANIKAYFAALSDLPLEAIKTAGTAFAREVPARKFFPNTSEWREKAQAAQAAALKAALPPAREEPWRFDCEQCEDSGWLLPMPCPGDTTCGRKRAHAAHGYTEACGCRATNRTYQRRQALGGD